MASSSNSSANIGTHAVFSCVCCDKTSASKAMVYTHPLGTKFLVCRGCFHRLTYLTTMPAQYTPAMRLLGNLAGEA